MFYFIKDIFENNIDLINSYRENFEKEETINTVDGSLKIKYCLKGNSICECFWKNENLSIYTIPISSSCISTSINNDIKLPVFVIAVILEELSFNEIVYFLDNIKKIKNLLNKFCSSNYFSIELDGKLKVDVVGVRGNLEECDLYKFPLIYFN